MDFQQAVDETLKELDFQPLKQKQKEAVETFVQGKDVFVSLPTGYGKSVIYAILPTLFDKMRGCLHCKFKECCITCGILFTGTTDSIVVCVSPLTSIMIDQQQKFSSKGIKAEFVEEAQTDPEVIQRVLQGKLQLLYISPENLLNNARYRSLLLSPRYKEKISALVVDEAHCIKTWQVNDVHVSLK